MIPLGKSQMRGQQVDFQQNVTGMIERKGWIALTRETIDMIDLIEMIGQSA